MSALWFPHSLKASIFFPQFHKHYQVPLYLPSPVLRIGMQGWFLNCGTADTLHREFVVVGARPRHDRTLAASPASTHEMPAATPPDMVTTKNVPQRDKIIHSWEPQL